MGSRCHGRGTARLLAGLAAMTAADPDASPELVKRMEKGARIVAETVKGPSAAEENGR